MRQLTNVGDASLGEWREMGGRAFHVRRRLTVAEELEVGPAVDIRGSEEALARAVPLGWRLRLASPDVLAEELGMVA